MKASSHELAKKFKIDQSRALESVIKAQLIADIVKMVAKKGLSHEMLAESSGIPRSAVTGILSGSVQKVTINRILRLVESVGLTAEIKTKQVA